MLLEWPGLRRGAGVAGVVLLMAIVVLHEGPVEPARPMVRSVAAAPAAPPALLEATGAVSQAAGSPARQAAPPQPAPAAWIEQAVRSQEVPLRAQAYRLLRHCAFVLEPGRARPLASPPAWMQWDTVRRADQAWQVMAQRCESLRALPDRAALERRLDPVPMPAANVSDAMQAQWLSQTFSEHGGAALAWAGEALVGYLERRTSAPDGDAFETLDAEAVQIARCQLGEDCGAESDAALAACLTLGACEGDVSARVLSTLASRPARERVLRQAKALVEALAGGDLSRYALGRSG